MRPSDFRTAYNLPVHGGAGKTVAVIEDGNDSYLEHDLYIYRVSLGLPPCTVSSGCLKIVDGSGGKNYPPEASDYGEVSLDVDIVSAICQDCKILVVETNLPNLTSPTSGQTQWIQALSDATKTAIALKAGAVSLSFAGNEWALDPAQVQQLAADFDHPGVPITASAGDAGFNSGVVPGVGFRDGWNAAMPAVFPTVVAVGGTYLLADSSLPRGYSEVANFTGSGCSYLLPAPIWQYGLTLCSGRRAFPDISFDAGGVLVRETILPDAANPTCPCGSWQSIGGTSVGAPAIAAAYMLDAKLGLPAPGVSGLYAGHTFAPQIFWNITSGTNSASACSPAILCNAGPGFNGPTGLGTPNGTAAFDPIF